MSAQTQLFDALGPKAKRRVTTLSWITAGVLGVIAVLVAFRLQAQGQLSAKKWSPLFNPLDENFNLVWTFLFGGLSNTALAGCLAIVLSLVIGTLLALSRVTALPWYRWIIVGIMEFFRAIPVVISIFFASRFLPIVGIDLPLLWYLVIGLTLYNSVAIAEIVRAGIVAVPKGQSEASSALGLTRSQNLWLVVLPQAFRLMLPSLISQLIIVVKDTALGFIIGFEELLRRGEIAVQTLGNPLQMYLLIGAIFILINYALSRLAEAVERRMSSVPVEKRKRSARVPVSQAA